MITDEREIEGTAIPKATDLPEFRCVRASLPDVRTAAEALLIATDAQMRITVWNSRAQEVFGGLAVERLGTPLVSLCELVDWDRWRGALDTCRTSQRTVRVEHVAFRTQSRRDGLLSLRVSPLQDTSARFSGFLTVAEEEPYGRSWRVGDVGGRTWLGPGTAREVRGAVDSAAQLLALCKNAMLDLCVLLQPLDDARGGTGEMHAIVPSPLARPAEVDALLREVPTALERCHAAVEHVSTIAHAIESLIEKRLIGPAAMDVQRVVAGAVEAFEKHHPRRFAPPVRCPSALPAVRGLSFEIGQAVLELLANAAHAQSIAIDVWSDGDDVTIQVEDDGSGIAPELQSHVFEPFFTTKEHEASAGRGLSFARNVVVDRHGGELCFRSVPFVRTQFRIVLPIAGPRGCAI